MYVITESNVIEKLLQLNHDVEQVQHAICVLDWMLDNEEPSKVAFTAYYHGYTGRQLTPQKLTKIIECIKNSLSLIKRHNVFPMLATSFSMTFGDVEKTILHWQVTENNGNNRNATLPGAKLVNLVFSPAFSTTLSITKVRTIL
jgi:hypothetical protein